MTYGDDEVVKRCRRGPIQGRSLGQISSGQTIGQVDQRLSLPMEDEEQDLTIQQVERLWEIGSFTPERLMQN